MPIAPFVVPTPMREESEKPELVEVILIDGSLNSGLPFQFTIAPHRGDSYEETDEQLTLTSGQTGQVTRIKQAQIASITILKRMVPKDLPKPPAKDSGAKLQ